MALWILRHPLTAAGQAGRRREFEAHFGAVPTRTYNAAVTEAQRIRSATRAIERGPAQQRLDTAIGQGQHTGQEVRIPIVVVATTRGTGFQFTRRIDVVVQAQHRLYQARYEVNAQAVDSADDSGADVDDIVFLPAPYYGPDQGFDYP